MDNYIEKLSVDQKLEMNRQLKIYSFGVSEIIPIDEFKNKLAKSIFLEKPMKIKLGLDPTAPDIHLGHTVILKKLKEFQKNGHIIQLIIGDFTGKIGDPTEKNESRRQLTTDEVKINAKTYINQFGKVLNPKKVELYYNSAWLSKLSLEDTISLMSSITVSRLMERKDFSNRMLNNLPISLHEFLYPLLQGYDSLELESDVELGGTDQHFNVLMGRHLQAHYHKSKQSVILLPLLEGTDGKDKMSKSKNNYIGINEMPNEMYGKIMSISDSLMIRYFMLVSNFKEYEIQDIEYKIKEGSLHPMDAKMMLAKNIVSLYHGSELGNIAEQNFIHVFQRNKFPENIPTYEWEERNISNLKLVDLLVKIRMQASKTKARNMIKNGGVRVNSKKITDENYTVSVEDGTIIQIGKRKYIKIVFV